MQDFYLNQNQVIFKDNFVSKMVLGIKTMNKFIENKEEHCVPPVLQVLHLRNLSPLSVHSFPLSQILSPRLPRLSPLVGALESLRHEQLPEVLRGEFLHVLAVVVNLPCWRVATCPHTKKKDTNTHTHRNIHTYIHLYTDIHTNRRRREGGGGRKQQHSKTSN